MTQNADLSAVVARVREQLASEASERTYIELSKPSAQALTDAASECAELRARLAARITERDAAEQGSSEWVNLYLAEKAECERLRGQVEEEIAERRDSDAELVIARDERDDARAECERVKGELQLAKALSTELEGLLDTFVPAWRTAGPGAT